MPQQPAAVRIRNAAGADCKKQHTVESAALSLEAVDNIHRNNGLTTRMLGVRDGVPNDRLEEGLEHITSFVVDKAGNTLDAATACQTTDGRLGNTLDVIPQHFAMPLGPALS